MIEPMAKVRLVCPRSLTEKITSSLHDAGALHVETKPFDGDQPDFGRGALDEETRDHQVRLERLREQLAHLLAVLPAENAAPSTDISNAKTTSLEKSLSPLVTRVDAIVTALKEHEDELSLISKYGNALESFAPYLTSMYETKTVDYLGLILDHNESTVETLKELMATVMGDRYELIQMPLDNQTLAVLTVFPTSYARKVRALMVEEGVTEFQLPTSVADKPFGQALSIVLQKKIALPSEIQQLQEKLQNLSAQWRGQISHWFRALNTRLEQINVSEFYYHTDMAVFIYGWIPYRRLDALSAKLHDEFARKVVIEELPIFKHERAEVPVVLRNSGFVKSFECLTRIIDLPRYGSIDPTPFIAVFFPLFYGAILGDIGYGLILLAATWFVRRQYRGRAFIPDVTAIAATASISAIVFGAVYGECFGSLGESLGIHPFVDRMDAFLPILIASIAVGLGYVSLGIVLGIVSAWRQGDWKESIAKAGGLFLVSGLGGLFATVAGAFPSEGLPWIVSVMGFACILIFGAGGVRAAMKLHNVVNVLSYLRIMGIGLASAALAFTANTLGGLVGNIVLAVAIGTVIHTLNLLFGILAPTIQSLRLHYVEFFENFFEAGGTPYVPFGRAAHEEERS